MLKECGEEKARGALHPKCRSKKRKISSLLSLHLFFLYGSFFLSFLLLEKKKMLRTKCLKRKCRNRRPKVGAKSERAEQKLEGKLPPFSAFFFFSMLFFSLFLFFFFLLEKKKMLGENVETKGQIWEGRNESQK